MYIIELASECAPMAKAGGLGEVVAGLSRELTLSGSRVEIIIPKYSLIDPKIFSELKMEIPNFQCKEKNNPISNTMWSAKWEECSLHLLEARHPAGYFHRDSIYGFDDDAARFLYFSKAALKYLQLKKEPIDILHIHDWHTAIAAVIARDILKLDIQAIVLTIHNGEYQGKCATWDLDAIGLPGEEYLIPSKLQDDDPEYPHMINLLKGGIVYADHVVAVSQNYAAQIKQSNAKDSLYKTAQKYHEKLTGIINGIDQKTWDPAKDKNLIKPYHSEQTIPSILEAKEETRKFLAKKYHLSTKHRPWLGAVTRIASQKGPDLLEQALETIISLQGTFILLGASQTPSLLEHFKNLQKRYAGNPQVFLQLYYEDPLAHQIYAALDFLIVPSIFEPCGLTQMIGMRYGTIPIVRATGGLKDTVFDMQNGIVFEKATKQETQKAVTRALSLFHLNQNTIGSIIANDMNQDFSWKKPGNQYLTLFESLTNKKTIRKDIIASGQKSV